MERRRRFFLFFQCSLSLPSVLWISPLIRRSSFLKKVTHSKKFKRSAKTITAPITPAPIHTKVIALTSLFTNYEGQYIKYILLCQPLRHIITNYNKTAQANKPQRIMTTAPTENTMEIPYLSENVISQKRIQYGVILLWDVLWWEQ